MHRPTTSSTNGLEQTAGRQCKRVLQLSKPHWLRLNTRPVTVGQQQPTGWKTDKHINEKAFMHFQREQIQQTPTRMFLFTSMNQDRQPRDPTIVRCSFSSLHEILLRIHGTMIEVSDSDHIIPKIVKWYPHLSWLDASTIDLVRNGYFRLCVGGHCCRKPQLNVFRSLRKVYI